ncbi:hypothetical protein CAP35_11810 [Chitinophagaceae bacterium IBVUCB1]|nr:hypothetical protein CAP35_11810 [Chitinophagaceae bacterium IBVUCB1]
MLRYLAIGILLIAASSCKDCMQVTRNVVADRETRKALPDALVKSVAAMNGRQDDTRYVYTDSMGVFETGYNKGGVAKCPVFKLTISKQGYYTNYFWEPTIGDTLFLVRITN